MMYCNQCGSKQPDDAVFCNQCGARMQPDTGSTPSVDPFVDSPNAEAVDSPSSAADESPLSPEARNDLYPSRAEQEDSEHTATLVPLYDAGHRPDRTSELSDSLSRNDRQPRFLRLRKALPWIVPIIVLIVAIICVNARYEHEQQVNRQVSAFHQQAQQLALQGKYDDSEQQLQSALNLRPAHKALSSDLTIVQTAHRIHDKLQAVSSRLKQNQLAPAEKSLTTLQQTLDKRQESIFAREKKLAARNQDLLAVLKVKQEVDGLDTVEALAYKLDEVERLDSSEADEVKTLIVDKIVNLSLKNAENLLQKNDFTAATDTVKLGLQYDENNDKLTSLQKRIASQQQAFEQAEQQRIERAVQQAEQEDLNNRTAAVEPSDVSAVLNEYGDIEISGSVENVATRSIYSVDVEYSAYDANGNYLFSSSAVVEPYYLQPGESGYYSSYEYGWYEQVTIQVDHITWYLD
ncbi:FxLYD domain-containing protein [Paenibacillus sp. WLX2291]|uniref:FxLYD domain-containing protein n=1 Tax=Paenibacillus sp. WLX2291 TaxID=3296934 RepID=UPI003984522C